MEATEVRPDVGGGTDGTLLSLECRIIEASKVPERLRRCRVNGRPMSGEVGADDVDFRLTTAGLAGSGDVLLRPVCGIGMRKMGTSPVECV